MTLACVSSWAQAAIDEPGGPVRMVVRDELWRALRIPAMIRKVDSDLRLSRAQGTIQVLATHRLADFEAVGAAGSEEVGDRHQPDRLLRRADLPAPGHRAAGHDPRAIGLTDTECAHIASWSGQQIGRAVWKVGRAASQSSSCPDPGRAAAVLDQRADGARDARATAPSARPGTARQLLRLRHRRPGRRW